MPLRQNRVNPPETVLYCLPHKIDNRNGKKNRPESRARWAVACLEPEHRPAQAPNALPPVANDSRRTVRPVAGQARDDMILSAHLRVSHVFDPHPWPRRVVRLLQTAEESRVEVVQTPLVVRIQEENVDRFPELGQLLVRVCLDKRVELINTSSLKLPPAKEVR